MKKENKKKIQVVAQIGIGLVAIGFGTVLGYSLGNKRFENASYGFDIKDNTNLVLKIIPDGSRRFLRLTFNGRATKEIVDHLMDEFYPGD